MGVITGPARTPVRVTVKRPVLRHGKPGRVEAWAAVSVELAADGEPLWTYERLDGIPGTPWCVRRNGTGGEAWIGSLGRAREATADGTALALIQARQAESALAERGLSNG